MQRGLAKTQTLVGIIQNEMTQNNDGRHRKNIQVGSEVEIVEKFNQESGELTDGFVKRFLTKSTHHPHGIKVELETGEIGRVKNVIEFEDFGGPLP